MKERLRQSDEIRDVGVMWPWTRSRESEETALTYGAIESMPAKPSSRLLCNRTKSIFAETVNQILCYLQPNVFIIDINNHYAFSWG